jgi:L-lactate dehydrogenase complex protein LldG
MTDARTEILARIEAIGVPAESTPPRAYRSKGSLERGAVVERFIERVRDYRATVHRVETTAVSTTIAACCAEQHARRLGIPPGLPAGWLPAGLDTVVDHGLAPRELDALDGAITGCTVAVAESGTIVLTAAPHEGRRALTLVPDLHVCVVSEDQIVELLPEAIERLVRDDRHRLPLTLISGPSATSDIELARVEGVHGPRRLVVIVAVSVQSGEADVDLETTAASDSRRDAGVVHVGDRLDDREPEPDATGGESLKRFEETLELAGRNQRTGVGDGKNSASGLGAGSDLEPAAGEVVPDRVRNEVGGESLEQLRVAARPRGLEHDDAFEPARVVTS